MDKGGGVKPATPNVSAEPLILNSNLRGALFMAIAMAGFSLHDAVTKLVLEVMSISQTMFLRGLFASILILSLSWRSGALKRPRLLLHPLVLLRMCAEAAASLVFLVVLSHLALGDLSAILQALPLVVTLGAALFLNEPVGWRRWSAIFVGFCGVMIIVRPGFEGFSGYAILALCCPILSAIRDLSTRMVPREVPSLLMSVGTALVVTLLGGAMTLHDGEWVPPTFEAIVLLLFAAILLTIGYQAVILAMREGDISFVAPFRYTALLWALLLSYGIFGDVPDLPTLAGASIVVLSGIYTLYRERRVRGGMPATHSTSNARSPDGL